MCSRSVRVSIEVELGAIGLVKSRRWPVEVEFLSIFFPPHFAIHESRRGGGGGKKPQCLSFFSFFTGNLKVIKRAVRT